MSSTNLELTRTATTPQTSPIIEQYRIVLEYLEGRTLREAVQGDANASVAILPASRGGSSRSRVHTTPMGFVSR